MALMSGSMLMEQTRNLGLYPVAPQANQKSPAAPVNQNQGLPEDENKYLSNSSLSSQTMDL